VAKKKDIRTKVVQGSAEVQKPLEKLGWLGKTFTRGYVYAPLTDGLARRLNIKPRPPCTDPVPSSQDNGSKPKRWPRPARFKGLGS
jgi:hypothetical protein